MEFNLAIRKKQLESLKQYVRSSEDNVNSVFQSLGWTIPKTLEKEEAKVVCPLNKNHLVVHKTLEKHLDTCRLKSAGYEENELFLSEPPEQDDCSIKLSNAKKIEILSAAKANRSDFKTAWNGRDLDPVTSNRFTSTFSVDERLALYDYSTKHTDAPPKPEEFTLTLSDPKEKRELSSRDKLALERDAKRRRVKYKSVHTSKKSQTEVMREVIDNQMALYTDWIKQKQEQERKEREKLRRLAKEKIKKKSSSDHNSRRDDQYQYIGTTYDQNVVSQTTSQWNQPSLYSGGAYGDEYYTTVQTSEGVITDWSHLYQGGSDTDYYTSSGQYQPGEGEFTEPISQSNEPYLNNLQVSNLDATSSSLYVNPVNAEEVDNHKVPARFKEPSKDLKQGESQARQKESTKREGTRQEKARKSYHSVDKGEERRY